MPFDADIDKIKHKCMENFKAPWPSMCRTAHFPYARSGIMSLAKNSVESVEFLEGRLNDSGTWQIVLVSCSKDAARSDMKFDINMNGVKIKVAKDGVGTWEMLSELGRYQQTRQDASEENAALSFHPKFYFEDMAFKSGIVFDLDGVPHPTLDSSVITEGSFSEHVLKRLEKARTPQLLTRPETESLSEIFGSASQAESLEYVLSLNAQKAKLDSVLSKLRRAVERLEETFESPKDDRKPSRQSMNQAFNYMSSDLEIEMEDIGNSSDRKSLSIFEKQLKLAFRLLSAKVFYQGLKDEEGSSLLQRIDAVKGELAEAEKIAASLGLNKAEKDLLKGFVNDGGEIKVPVFVRDFMKALEGNREKFQTTIDDELEKSAQETTDRLEAKSKALPKPQA